jgi:hypothetical protein
VDWAYSSLVRFVRLVAIPAAAVLVLASVAAAVATERFSVGGDTDAKGWSKALHVVLVSPAEYERESVGRFGNDGVWKGPPYWASQRRTLGGNAAIDWGVDIAKGANAVAAIRAGWVHEWPEAGTGSEPIERVVGGRAAGTVAGTWIITKADYAHELAQYEGAVGFSVCGLWAIVTITTLTPSSDSAGGGMGFGEYYVKGTVKPSVWNREKILESFRNVRLEGSLPAARVTAARRGRRIAGAATDCHGAPVAATRVTLERQVGRRWVLAARGMTSATGAYSFRAPRAGRYRAVVGARRSAPVRVT